MSFSEYKPSMTTLVLSPLKLELDALLARMKQLGHSFNEKHVGSLKVYDFAHLGLLFSLAGHGKTQFALQTQSLIDRLTPTAVVCAGCAGALNEHLETGDVVVAEHTIEHDFRERFRPRTEPEFAGDVVRLNKARTLKPDGYQIHFGKIASGDEDIIDKKRALELVEQTKALAVAWEGAGGARACLFNQIPFLEIRGITDNADHSAVLDFKKNLKIAMSNIADLILQLI